MIAPKVSSAHSGIPKCFGWRPRVYPQSKFIKSATHDKFSIVRTNRLKTFETRILNLLNLVWKHDHPELLNLVWEKLWVFPRELLSSTDDG